MLTFEIVGALSALAANLYALSTTNAEAKSPPSNCEEKKCPS